MPNWCTTDFTFYGEDADKLYKKILRWTSHNYESNGFGKCWLGNVVAGSNIADIESNDCPSCRGSITFIEKDSDKSFVMTTETAWGTMLEMWDMIIKKYAYDVTYDYVAEEPGLELFITNNMDVAGKYFVDSDVYDVELPIDYYASEYEVCDYLKRVLKAKNVSFDKKEDNLQQLKKLVEEKLDEDGGYVYISQFSYCDACETY